MKAASDATLTFDPPDYWEKRHGAHPGSLRAVGHRLLSEEQNAQQYAIKHERILAAIERSAPGRGECTLLDAGCGSGVFSRKFVDRGFRVVGIDFSATAIAAARKQVPEAEFAVSSLANLDLRTRFDVVTAIDVLLHIVSETEWQDTLEALARHLAPGGSMVILDCLRPSEKNAPPHCKMRDEAAYHRAFQSVGLNIVDHERFELTHEQSTKDLLVCRAPD